MSLNSDLNKNESTLFGVSAELRDKVEILLANYQTEDVVKIASDLHSADIANLINLLRSQYIIPFVQSTKHIFSSEVIIDIDYYRRKEIIQFLGIEQISKYVQQLDSDDATSFLEELDYKLQQEIINMLSLKQQQYFQDALSYPEKSAGRLMQNEVVYIDETSSVKDAVNLIKNSKNLPYLFYDIFIINSKKNPIGKVSINQLLRHKPQTKIAKIMHKDIYVWHTISKQTDISHAFKKYALVSTPVVNNNEKIIGMITIDDIVDVIDQEAEEDLLHLGNIHKESDFSAPVFNTAYWRIKWLMITLINALIASYVISQFTDSIQQIASLSFLMTINAAMAGNSGMQVSTVMIRALATHSILSADTWQLVKKELNIALIVGIFCATVIGGITSIWLADYKLGMILSVSIFANMLWAGLAGSLLPLVINRMGMDPAIGAGPILTTTTDVLGYAIFLGLATFMLL